MKNKGIGWKFPEKGDGGCDSFNDAGIETFRGDRYSSLAREILQNSLDAKDSGNKPVLVTFELIYIQKKEVPGYDELKNIMKKCQKEAILENADDKELNFFKSAVKILEKDRIPCLKIDDYHTTGLRGNNDSRQSQWYAITKMTGGGAGKKKEAGGSYGIGKNATFATSDLRTVFYYTMYQNEEGEIIEKFQGKSILTTHKSENNKNTQGAGYYGIVDECQPIEGRKDIPSILELREKKENAGTCILIPGFRHEEKNWIYKIATVVLSNFFHAVYSEQLQVMVVSPANKDKSFFIKKENLETILSELLASTVSKNDIYKEKLNNVRAYLDAIKNTDTKYKRETENRYLGRCTLFVVQKKGLPKKVGVIRKTGMLITDEMPGLKRFSGMSDFAAVLLCSSSKGNILLRNIENPQHNQFEPERIDNPEEAKKGQDALRSIAKWVREQLGELVGEKSDSEEEVDITELSKIFPSIDDDTIINEKGERNFEGNVIISPKPYKGTTYTTPKPENDDDDSDSDTDDSKHTGEGKGTYTPTQKTSKAYLGLKNFRILRTANAKENGIVFTPEFDGDALLGVYIAGDSDEEEVEIEKITAHDNMKIIKTKDKKISKFLLKKCKENQQIRLNITFKEKMSYPLTIKLSKP